MIKSLAFVASLAAPNVVFAQVCPPAPDFSAEKQELIAALQTALNELNARELSNRLWEIWATAPDGTAQEMLDRGMMFRSRYDFANAIWVFDELVRYCPNYAEGYNQRAFVNFLRQDFASALIDLDRALDLSPDHIAALSGRALTLIGLGRDEEGQAALRDALKLNPWLSERALLIEPVGQDI